MAQKIRVTLILLACLAAVCFAATKADIKKFPPVSGEIYGQAAPGVRSISVNGKPVIFDAHQNFRATVKLIAGEKYLTLKINYEGLRIIKKYLILRRSPIKQFRVFVPKEKIEKTIQAAKPSKEALFRKAREKERKGKLLALKEKEKVAIQEKSWMKKVPSPKFYAKEFEDKGTITALNKAIVADNYGIPFSTSIESVDRTNEILQMTNFYEYAGKKRKTIALTPQLKTLIKETSGYRGKPFVLLSDFQKKKIMLLNRLLIETIYAQAPKRAAWIVVEKLPKPAKAVSPTKVCEYLYVWEFSEGKLLLVKEKKGSFSAEIYIPVAKEWLELRGLSEKELGELIAKPIKVKKKK